MKKFNFSKGLITGLLTFALCIVAFAAVGAKADEQAAAAPEAVAATYSFADNSITSASNAVVYVLKQEKGNTIKKGAAATGTIAAGKKTALTDLKVKGTTKDVYLYVCNKEFEDEGKVDANLVIKAQAAKKVVGKIDYTKADTAAATTVLSITATDSNKKAIENPECVWSAEAEGTYAASTTFTGATLAKMLEDGGGVIYVKMIGVDGGSGTAQFASKAIKVKIAKQAKAPKVKYDPKKDTIALKNGYDFALAEKNNDKYTVVGAWQTILPVLKDANIKTAANSIVATTTYVPCDKKDTGVKDNTTQYKFKTISMDTIIAKLGNEANADFVLAVRKTATAKKPASEVAYINFPDQTAAPIVYTANKVAGEYDIATVTDFDKKGFAIGTVVNYNGVDGTEGFWNTFALKSTPGTGADKNAASYEFCVVKLADISEIDWTTVAWKKLDPAKTKITSKLKTKYSKIGATSATEATLKAFAKPENFTATSGVPEGTESVLLVRRAGVKGDTPVRPSDYIRLYVIKDGKNYTLYSTAAVGEAAKKYTVAFFKYNAATTEKAAGFYRDETIAPIVGYTKKANTGVTLEALTDADYFPIASVAQATGIGTIANDAVKYSAAANEIPEADGTDKIAKGDYSIALDGDDVTVNIAICEYANIKVKVFTKLGDADAVAVTAKDVTVAKGKIGNGAVAYYVGTACVIDVAAPATPTASADDKQVVAATTANTIVGGTFANNKVTVTPASAEEVEVTLTYNFIEQDKE